MLDIKKQLSKLYSSSVLGNLSLTGAWVAILAARDYSLVEIGIAETVFHIVSLIFEIPSGVLADVFGRKKMLLVSTVMRMIGNVIMILSDDLFTVCMSIAFMALSYNFSSGTDEALAYDSLKLSGQESRFEKFCSNQLIIYRLCSGISTLCAGFALTIGHRIAYGTDLLTGIIQIAVLSTLHEIYAETNSGERVLCRLLNCFKESFDFIKKERKAARKLFCRRDRYSPAVFPAGKASRKRYPRMGSWFCTAVYGNGRDNRFKADTEISESKLQNRFRCYLSACACRLCRRTFAALLCYGSWRNYLSRRR